jgi:hypothetical protein
MMKSEYTNMGASSEQIALAAEDFFKVPVIDQSESPTNVCRHPGETHSTQN